MWMCHREMYINGIMILRGQGPDGAPRTAASWSASAGVDGNGSDTWLLVLLDTSAPRGSLSDEAQMGRDPVLEQNCVNLSDGVWESSRLRSLQVI